jgi:hypothetical protein
MYLSSQDPHKVLFIGREHLHFHTLDMGASYVACPEIAIQDVRLHPTQHSWVLASAMAPGCAHTTDGFVGQECFKIVSTAIASREREAASERHRGRQAATILGGDAAMKDASTIV